MRLRLRSLFSWASVPWQRPSLGLALVVASAVPAFLLASADVRQAATGDRLADRLLDELGDDAAGVTITATATFADPTTAERADGAVRAALDAVGDLEPATRTLYTPIGAAVGPVGDGGETAPLGVPIRLIARSGSVAESASEPDDTTHRALDAGADGPVWISTWLADQTGLAPGDTVRLVGEDIVPVDGDEAGRVELTVAGTYPTPWSQSGGAPTGFWSEGPAFLVPRYLSPFQEPSFELLVVPEATIAASGLPGWARWDAPRLGRPLGIEALREAVGRVDAVDLALRRGPLAVALAAQAGGVPATPDLASGLPASLDQVDTFIVELAQPLAATRFAGAFVGVAVMIAGVALLVVERWSEFRLLAAEGDRWIRFTGRTALQLVLPAALGLVGGVISALALARADGITDRLALDDVDRSAVVVAVVAGVVLAAGTVGILGPRTLIERSAGAGSPATVVVTIVGLGLLAALMWRQVGQPAGDRATVDPAVITLPVVAIGAVLALMLTVLAPVVRRLGKRAGMLPPVVYLAWRRIGDDQVGGRLLVAVLAVGLGLVAVATTTGRALDRGVERKLSTEVGAESQVTLIGRQAGSAALPPTTTLVRSDTTRVTPLDRRVKIVAVDPATFADAVVWTDPEVDVHEVLALLDGELGDDIPAVGIIGQGLPTEGAFGLQRNFPYRLVGTVSALPLATDFGATLLVSADYLDRFELVRLARAMGRSTAAPEVEAAYRAPSTQMSRRLLSALPAEELVARLDDEQIRHRDVRSLAERLDDVDVLAPRVAFEQLELVGLVASAASAAALVLYLEARRRRRRLASFLLRRMGLERRSAAAVTAIEVMAVTAVALVVVAVVAPPVAGRLIDRFDPAPTLPPELDVGLRWPTLAAIGVLVVAIIGLLVWAGEYAASRRDDGRVVRHVV